MADRLVYYGEFKNHKKEDLIKKAIAMLKDNRGDKFYYLLPNGSLLKDYRERFIRELGATFEINLFTFDDIVQTLLKDSPYILIDNIWKSFAIRQVLEDLDLRGQLRYYKNISGKEGFIESVNFIIGEIKRSLVSPKEFLEKSPPKEEFQEIGLIYSHYEDYMEDKKLMDREGSYLKALELLRDEGNNFSDIELIIIDEFYDFRPIEIEILKLMKESQVDIYINMPFKMDYNSAIIEDTISILKGLSFHIEVLEEKKEDLFMDLGRGFFDYGSNKFQPTKKLTLIEAASRYLEIKKVFTIIKSLYAEGKALSSMGIVALSEDYKQELIRVSLEEEIPIAIGIQTRIIRIPFIREFLNSLEDNYKSLVKDVDIRPIDSFENYQQLMLDLIDKIELRERIEANYLKTEDFQIYRRDLLAFNSLLSILQAIEKIESPEALIDFDDYFQILSSYLEEEDIYIRDENLQGVNIMNPLNTRGFQYDSLFVVGLGQDEYPVLKSNNFLIRDEHGELLKNIGIKYWNYDYRLDNEVVKFASILANAGEKLYLSYSSEGQGIPSMFLEEILYSFENEKTEDKLDFIKVELDYIFKNNLDEINTKEELANYLLLKLDKAIDKKDAIFGYYNELEANKLLELNAKLEGEYKRTLDDFNEYRGKISDKAIAQNIKDMHRDKIYSATYLETYSKCPFAFFMKHILLVEEDIEEEDYNALNIGSIYHGVLRSYFSKYKYEIERDIRAEEVFHVSKTLDYLKSQVIEEAQARKLDIEKKSSLLVLETIYFNLKSYIEMDIARLKEKDEKMMPFEFEFDFGITSPFSIDVDGRQIFIMGRIDRIDKILDEEKYIVIDYKSGSSGIYGLEDMRDGLSLQIPIYMLAQRQRNIVLGIYGQIKAAKFQHKIGVIDEISLIPKSNAAAITSEERDQLLVLTEKNINNIVHSIERADFSVNPKECSDYCSYKHICRYDSSVEVDI